MYKRRSKWDKKSLLVFLSSKLLCAIVKELLIHLHEKLQSVVDETMDGPVNRHSQLLASNKNSL